MDIIISAAKIAFMFVWILSIAAVMTWVERRGAGLIQDRPGPNRVGPFGLFQPLADGIKFFMKEDLIPMNASKVLFFFAPFMFAVPAFAAYAVIPFGDKIVIGSRTIFLQISDVNIGFLYVLALSSIGLYGIVTAGWSSNNKYSMLGALRSTSQLISYEIPLGLALLGIVLVYSTFSLREIGVAQNTLMFGFLPKWGIVVQPLGFIIYIVAAFAECNRMPFDLPEGESEIVAGYHTEFGSMKLGLFMFSEYINMYVLSAIMTTVYFGAWHLPWVDLSLYLPSIIYGIVSFLIFFAKVFFFLWVFVWVRWTVPRFRYDQLTKLGWKILLPLALVNIFITSLIIQLSS